MTKATSAERVSDSVFKIVIPSMTLLLAVGTGGESTLDYYRIREAKLVVNSPVDRRVVPTSIDVASAASDLSRIRAVLKISTSDLARTLGVSRQAIYNWKSGSHIKAHNLSKLANLKLAADEFVQSRITVSSEMLDRTLPGGKTLLERIAEGMDGSAAAYSLINLLRADSERRKEMDALLAENISRPANRLDYGAPAFNED